MSSHDDLIDRLARFLAELMAAIVGASLTEQS